MICDFCDQLREGRCRLDIPKPRGMSCRSFDPQMSSFCSNPADFVNAAQIVGMAKHFEMRGAELKKVREMVERAEKARGFVAQGDFTYRSHW